MFSTYTQRAAILGVALGVASALAVGAQQPATVSAPPTVVTFDQGLKLALTQNTASSRRRIPRR